MSICNAKEGILFSKPKNRIPSFALLSFYGTTISIYPYTRNGHQNQDTRFSSPTTQQPKFEKSKISPKILTMAQSTESRKKAHTTQKKQKAGRN